MMDVKETRVTFADEPGLRAARIKRSFVDQGVMKDWTRLQGEQAFISGRVGFYAASTSWLKGVQDKTSGRSAQGFLQRQSELQNLTGTNPDYRAVVLLPRHEYAQNH